MPGTLLSPTPVAARTGRDAVDLRGLTKRYGDRVVVDDLEVRVPTGSICGFLGPNGAGKTTTLRMLLGLVAPSAGAGHVLGRPFADRAGYLHRVGALIEGPAFWPGLSGRRALRSLAVLGGHDPARVDVLLDRVGLAGRGDDRVGTYSLGMKQRLGIAAALLGEPELLVLDEPTNGLDPGGIRDTRELLRSLAGDGLTVLVSSHLLAEVEQVCDWLIVVDHGRSVFAGPAGDLLAGGARRVTVRPERADDLGVLADVLAGLGLSARAENGHLRLDLDGDGGDAPTGADRDRVIGDVVRAAVAAGVTLVEIADAPDSLEDRFQAVLAPTDERTI